MTLDIMLDIETLGNTPGCVITQIAAVDANGSVFNARISLKDSLSHGLHCDAQAVQFWLLQPEQARAAMHSACANGVALISALHDFTLWLAVRDAPTDGAIALWGFPASYDLVLIEALYRKLGKATPWHYRAPRCLRTAAALSGVPRPTREGGTAHVACLDAADQMAWLKAIQAKLGIS